MVLLAALATCAARAQQTAETGVTLHAAGAAIHVEYEPSRLPVSWESVDRWIVRAADAVASYFGRFPVEETRLLVISGGPGKISGGFTAYGDAFTRVVLGDDTTEADLEGDWVMTHEFVHLAHPSLGKPWAWMEEGLATYVEPLARVKAGTLSPDEVWRWMIEGLPFGVPQQGDAGLDFTHTWGRTYWGGALFCLLADLEIRAASGGRTSLETALRGVLSKGGDVRARWGLDRMLREGDAAAGVDVLERLHALLGSTPTPVDVEELLKLLGVASRDGRIVYDDGAPLATMRKAIVATVPESQGTR
jgi:hypothetical protein